MLHPPPQSGGAAPPERSIARKLEDADALVAEFKQSRSIPTAEEAVEKIYDAHHPIPEGKASRQELTAAFFRLLGAIDGMTNPEESRFPLPVSPVFVDTPEGRAKHERQVRETPEKLARAEFQLRLAKLIRHADLRFSYMIVHLFGESAEEQGEFAQMLARSGLPESRQKDIKARVSALLAPRELR